MVAPVVSIAVANAQIEIVLDGPEREILQELDEALRLLPAGILITWNGGGFDLPFLHDRARALGIDLGLEMELDASAARRRHALLGHFGTYRARWHQHRHLDGYQLFRADVGATLHLPCGLKPLSRFVGLPVVEVDRERIHELTEAERRAYVASDAHLARQLVLRRANWLAAVDQLTSSSGT